jgi:hypothetical protein
MDIDDFDIFILFQVFTQLGHKNIHTPCGEVGILSPDLIQASERGRISLIYMANMRSS